MDGEKSKPSMTTEAMNQVASSIASLHSIKDPWSKFERAVAGMAPERREEMARIISNLGLRPDDPEVMLLAVAGYAETIAIALECDLESASENAAQVLSTRLMDDFARIECDMSKRIASMEEASLVVVEAAVQAAADAAGEATRDMLGNAAAKEVEGLSADIAKRIEKLKSDLFEAMNRVVNVRVKEEKQNSRLAQERLKEKLLWFGVGAGSMLILVLAIQMILFRH
jgi:hypothetical protein